MSNRHFNSCKFDLKVLFTNDFKSVFFHSFLRYTVTCDGARVLYRRDRDNFNCTSIENIVHLSQSGYTEARAQKIDPFGGKAKTYLLWRSLQFGNVIPATSEKTTAS